MSFPTIAATNTEVRIQMGGIGAAFIEDAEIDQQIIIATSHIGEIIKDAATDTQQNIATLMYATLLSYDIAYDNCVVLARGREAAEITATLERKRDKYEEYMIPLEKPIIDEDVGVGAVLLGAKAAEGYHHDYTEGPLST